MKGIQRNPSRNPPRAAAEATAYYLRENFGNVPAARRLATQLETATTDAFRTQLLQDAECLLAVLQGDAPAGDSAGDPHELDRALMEGSLMLGRHGLASRDCDRETSVQREQAFAEGLVARFPTAIRFPPAVRYNVAARYIDTCYSDFLTDHHTRAGELLLGVPVVEGMSANDVITTLMEGVDSSMAPGDLPEEITDEQLHVAFTVAVQPNYMPNQWGLEAIWNADEIAAHEEDETPSHWFVLTWEREDEE